MWTSTLLVSQLEDGPQPHGRCAELACCVRHPHRVVIAGSNRGRRPRVATDGSNRGRRPPRVAIAGSNRGFSRLHWSTEPTLLSLLWYKPWFDFLLVSLTWFKPRERLSLANRWMCQYPYGKNTGVRTMVQTGGKVTCTSWELNPWCEVQPRVATPWCEAQPRVATPWCEVQPLG